MSLYAKQAWQDYFPSGQNKAKIPPIGVIWLNRTAKKIKSRANCLPVRCSKSVFVISDQAVSCSQSRSSHMPANSHSLPAECNGVMSTGQIIQTAFAPLVSFENEMIKMVSRLHFAFSKLASQSKILFVDTSSLSIQLILFSVSVTDLRMFIKIR